MKIQLSDHFDYRRLFRYTLPSIVMMIFTSLYGIVDGYFVSNYAGKTDFAAVNFIIPFLMILSCIGFMLGAGGSALIGMLLGQQDKARANRVFSMLVYVTIAGGALMTLVGMVFIRPLAVALGAEGEMLSQSVVYGRICLVGLTFGMLQMEFQSFFPLAERPHHGLWVTVVSGISNMVLDWLLVGVLPWGVVGAAVATVFSQFVGAVIPIVYFACRNGSLLKLGRARLDLKALWLTCTNGSSEMMSSLAMSFVGMLYNMQLLKYAGEDGVAAYGVLMYFGFICVAFFIGYAIGVAPVVSYHFGAGNHGELKSLLRKSMVVNLWISLATFVVGFALAGPMAALFTGYDGALSELTCRAFRYYSFSFLFMGVAIFGSSFFTALNDGLTSALISFLRTLVFQLIAVMVMPVIWGVDGIWLSLVVAELSAMATTMFFLRAKSGKYHYY